MWEFTKKNEQDVKKIYNYFLPKYPSINPKCLYDRILVGYCYGEGGKIWLMSIEDWANAFQGDKFYTVFDSWEDYLKHNGDWHKKVNKL